MQQQSYDVIIIGAGISGISSAYYLQKNSPQKTFAILEARENIGGTWDLFKYPGIRSDSDMLTFGFSFNLWKNAKTISEGNLILEYLKETVEKFGIDKKIQFNQKVTKAEWRSEEKNWDLHVFNLRENSFREIRARFLMMCSGYYNYEAGYNPEIAGSETFKGIIVHPQKWDANINYDNKNVVVIGSGATAVTIVPVMAQRAKKLVMLQRSPTYIMNLPATDISIVALKRILPEKFVFFITRWRNIIVQQLLYFFFRKFPNASKKFIAKQIRKILGDDYDMKNFSPSYNPWDQRLCLVPDNDLFKSIKSGKAEVVTDTIKEITPNGILLRSGKELPADIIVKATGLQIQLLGGMEVFVNGKKVDTAQAYCYRGVMLSGVPNLSFTFGYVNASWTLKAELISNYVTRLLNYMDAHNYKTVTPTLNDELSETRSAVEFDAGYIKRAADILPKQGSFSPWLVYQNYFLDRWLLKGKKVSDRFLEFE